jgi:esterase/lipase
VSERIHPPGLLLQMLEGRVGGEYTTLMLRLPMLRLHAPRGHREPVMVLPGFMADDDSTWFLRAFLTAIGYSVSPWGLGRSRGPMLSFLQPTIERIEALRDKHGSKVKMVGWSRGGILSREVARDRPDLIDRVITLGSPVKGGAGASSISRLVERETGINVDAMRRIMRERNRVQIEVPICAIYSKSDGVVAWQACIDDTNPNVEHHVVAGSHTGLGFNADVYRLVANALSE